MRGAQQSLVRAMNHKLVCDLLKYHGTLSRVDLARLANLSVPALIKITDRLTRLGVIREAGAAQGLGPGPRARLFGLSESHGIVTAVRITEDHIEVAHSTLAGTTLAFHRADVDRHSPAEQILRMVHPPDPRQPQILAVGIPGPVDADTGALLTDELRPWPPGVGRRLQQESGAVSVLFENAIHLQALAEHVAGAAQSNDDFAWIYIGDEVRVALMMEGTLRRGSHGSAGELNTPWTTTPRADDWGQLAAELGPHLGILAGFVDPALIVLGGPLPRQSGEALVDALYRWFAENYPRTAPEVRASTLAEDAVLHGAEVLGWDALITYLLS